LVVGGGGGRDGEPYDEVLVWQIYRRATRDVGGSERNGKARRVRGRIRREDESSRIEEVEVGRRRTGWMGFDEEETLDFG
jgi:hypothetical protein